MTGFIHLNCQIDSLDGGQGSEVCLYDYKYLSNNKIDWLNRIKESRNHFHLFTLGIEELLCKDKSWLESQL